MFFKPSDGKSKDNPKSQSLIEMYTVDRVYKIAAGGYQALKSIDLEIGRGKFVGMLHDPLGIVYWRMISARIRTG